MQKEKDYNQPLRSSILICSIRCEEAASDALRNLLRTVKPDSKTLSSKSSSLSFKNKIDLLYDIDDIDKDDYGLLLKFMEIRNQFIHNPNCNSFIDLSKQAPELTNFLITKLPNDQKDEETSYKQSFKDLFMRTIGKLLILKLEYRKGYTHEMYRYIDAKTLENFQSIYKVAFDKWKADKRELKPIPSYGFNFNNSEEDITNFEYILNITILDEKIKICDAISNNEVTIKDVFKRREELLVELKKERKEAENKKEQTI